MTRHILNSKATYLLGLTSLLLIVIICAAFSFTGSKDYDLARQDILLRKIGHEMLLHSGDSTSRVLPVEKIGDNEYRVRFEKELIFQPDTLIKIISRVLAQDNLSHDYIVNVLNCPGKAVIFGYAIAGNVKDNILSCSGRKQPKSCYILDLKFKNEGLSAAQKGCLAGGIPLLAFIGLFISRSVRSGKNTADTAAAETETFQIGQTLFDPHNRQLVRGENITGLTTKENKLLLIFARSPNVVIERSRLQKEIWEDEGVIVGRSLDMFISKLRKKLENDSSIQLSNVHGKGYKLHSKN